MKSVVLKTTNVVKNYISGRANEQCQKTSQNEILHKRCKIQFCEFLQVVCSPGRLFSQITKISRYQFHVQDRSLQLRLFIGFACNQVTLCRFAELGGAEKLTSSSHFCLSVCLFISKLQMSSERKVFVMGNLVLGLFSHEHSNFSIRFALGSIYLEIMGQT